MTIDLSQNKEYFGASKRRHKYDEHTSNKKGFERDLPQFESVKRKLTFDEDFMSSTSDHNSLPFESGANIDDNPFMKLLDSAETVPTFNYSHVFGQDNNANLTKRMALTGGKSKSKK